MNLFGGTVALTGAGYFIFCIFVIACLGYLLGSIKVKNVSLGTAGVFVIALLFGAFFFTGLDKQLTGNGVSYASNALKIVENMGLALFVTSVGFIAGPTFLETFKENFKSYILLGLIIIASGAAVCVAIVLLTGCETPMAVGLMAGALTSTPAFSAAKETTRLVYGAAAENYEAMVTVGYGIAYLFGVIGVVLFVQIIPRILKVDVTKKIAAADGDEALEAEKKQGKRGAGSFNVESRGFMPFALAVLLGSLIGAIKIPVGSGTFSLGTTGGVLMSALLLGHLGHIGRLNVRVKDTTLNIFQELGLMLFLIGAGVAGGANFAKYFKPIYFLYGALMTVIPMVIGFLFAKHVLKISLLNNLGSITGGMTSTPALGTLVSMTGSNDVVAAYASTYPIALLMVVLAAQFILTLFVV